MNLVEHTKARFNYDILERFEAGIELLGLEVKSLRAGKGKLDGAHVIVRGGEAFLVGMSVPAYQPLNTPQTYDAERSRKLLLTKKEIAALSGFEGQKGLTIIPIAVYSKGRTIKLSLGAARGRKKYDKRRVIKERETRREIERTLKNK